MADQNYYPSLKGIISTDNLPAELNFLNSVLEKIFYKNLRVYKSKYGEKSSYYLDIMTAKLELDVFGSGMKLVVNPDATDANASIIPIEFFFNLEIIRYINKFNLADFGNDFTAYYNLLVDISGVNSDQLLSQAIDSFVDDTNPVSKFISDYNIYPGKLLTLTSTNDISVLLTELETNTIDTKSLIFDYFIQNSSDSFESLRNLFFKWLGSFSLLSLKNLITPNFKLTLSSLSLSLTFPRKWLIPAKETSLGSGIYIESNVSTELSQLKFNVGSLGYSSKNGFEFNDIDPFIDFQRSFVGKTGLQLEFLGVKLDLSKTNNIPEAIADGRPDNFQGVYAEEATVTLPEKWFKNQVPSTTVEIKGRDLLIGTGGISGTIGLETVGTIPDPKLTFDIGDNGFKVDFKRFDIAFKQNKIISSSIKGGMLIPKFEYPASSPKAGDPVYIDIEAHIQDNGDFNLTASAKPPYPIEVPGVFKYHMDSLGLGKEGDEFYLETSGAIELLGKAKELLKLKPIQVEKLRIYSDGSIDIKGGSIALEEPIIANLGPVELTVSALHIGSDQKEIDGVTRKFSYFGLDGGLKVDPLGVEIRGDGVKFFYCSDDKSTLDPSLAKPKPYMQIKTLRLDLTIPSTTPTAIIEGWLTIPEPGVSKEYAGGISLEMPQIQKSGKADMKLMPKYPAFIIDAEFDAPIPIPLGPFTIYEFRGLLGYRYVAEKSAAGLDPDNSSWFDYYKVAPRGIHVTKFNGPDKTKKAGTPFSIGAGASMGTSGDNGTVMNLKAMVLLSIPSLFMISGKAAIISARLKLEDTKEPPFFAFVAIGDNSLEIGFGADFSMETKKGDLVTTHAEIQAGFFFKDKSKWYVNIGTRENPVTSRILDLMSITAYLMLSAKGMEAGARAEFSFKREYVNKTVKVDAFAYIELGGKISFERPQFGAYLQAGVSAEVNIKVVSLFATFDILFSVEGPQPYKIYGEFRFCVKIVIAYVFKFEFCGDLAVSWEFNKSIDKTPVDPLINEKNKTNEKLSKLVKGVSMLSNETFDLAYEELTSPPTTLLPAFTEKIIPLDTYIDIKTEKGLLVKGNVKSKIGGLTNPPKGFIENVPPQKVVKGKVIRQVKHQYSIEEISVKSWNPTTSTWEDYHPYQAIDPSGPDLTGYKIGQFQKSGKEYNTIRLLATSPFTFTDHGPSNWNIPEQNGISAATLFCEGEKIANSCANFELKSLNQKYHCYDNNHAFSSNEVSFLLINKATEEYAEVVNESNSHGFTQSLAFDNHNTLQITLPEPSDKVGLKLSSHSQNVTIRYYSDIMNYGEDPATSFKPILGHPNKTASNQNEPHEVVIPVSQLNTVINHDKTGDPNYADWRPIIKIEIIPESSNQVLIEQLIEEIASINHQNKLIELGLETGPIQSTEIQEASLQGLYEANCSIDNEENENELNYDLCQLYYQLKPFENCLVESEDWQPVVDCTNQILTIINNFNTSHPVYDFINLFSTELNDMSMFVSTPDNGSFSGLLNAFNTIIAYLLENGNCQTPCVKVKEICDSYNSIKALRDDFLPDPRQINTSNFTEYKNSFNDVVSAIQGMTIGIDFTEKINIISLYDVSQSRETYEDAWNALQSILDEIMEEGNCDCGEDEKHCHTLFHEVCWLDVDKHQYNINIPSQTSMDDDNNKTIDNIKNNIQPVWRPNTSYYVHFKLRDTVMGKAENYDEYYYGFTTAGPVGYFHTDDKATYGDIIIDPSDLNSDILEDANGIYKNSLGVVIPQTPPLIAHPEKYPLTSLSQYIDYKRSYPNADGNLLSAKPLFYNDETTKVDLFFVQTYAKYFFKNWDSYNGKNAIDGRIKVIIKDPREKDTVDNPPNSIDDASAYLSAGIPQGIETWEADKDPIESHAVSKYLNLAKENNCTVIGGIEDVKPKADKLKVELANLKPQKLYTAIVNNMFDIDENGSYVTDLVTKISNNREVHKFVFQTSRYASFKDQVNSYILSNSEIGPDSKNAIFNLEKTIPQADLTAVWDTISGNANAISDGLKTKYQHAFDRVLEGILGITPIHEPISTEFNVIKSNDKIVALLVKNPEPFNNPKIPLDIVSDTIQVLNTSGNADTDYKVLYSKDYSQAIIMHSSFEIANVLDIQFQYKVWDGSGYIVPSTTVPDNTTYSSDEIGTIVIQNLDLINN